MPPKRVRNLTFFDFFILGKRSHRIAKNLHTDTGWHRILCLTEGHIFLLTQRRKVSQSVCAVLRRLRAIIFTRNPRNPQKSLHVFACIYSYFFWATNGHEFSLMPCGALLFHADGADLRRSMRSKILCVPWISVWDKILDIRTKWHIFLLTQRRKVSQSICVVLRCLRAIIFTRNTRNTQKSLHVFARIYRYFLSHEWTRIFTNAVRSVIVSRRRRRHPQKHAEQNSVYSVSSVWNHAPLRMAFV